MPEVSFTIRWPDGTSQLGRSPSRAITELITEGAVYPCREFVRRARDGLDAASDRVRERYGFACTATAEQLDAIQVGAARQSADPDGMVAVERLRVDPPPLRFPVPDRLDGHH